MNRPRPCDSRADGGAGGVSDQAWGEGVADRRLVPDRRRMLERPRRANDDAVYPEEDGAGDSTRGSARRAVEFLETGLERRRGPGRRRTDFMRSAEEGEMTAEQFLFLMAIDAFKRANHKTFPTWTDVLEIVRRLGYRKVQSSTLTIPQAEDWHEPADAPLWPAKAPAIDDVAAATDLEGGVDTESDVDFGTPRYDEAA